MKAANSKINTLSLLNRLMIACAPLLGIAIVSGCGPSRDATVPVSGSVTLDGKPVRAGTVVFYPSEGRSAIAEIDENGRYELTTYEPGDGARIGDYKVTVEARSLQSSPVPSNTDDDHIPIGPPTEARVVWLVPEKYADIRTTPLSVEVNKSGKDIDLDLSSKH